MEVLLLHLLVILQVCSLPGCEASILLYDTSSARTISTLNDFPTDIGPSFPISGVKGHHIYLEVNNTCSSDLPPPSHGSYPWFAVILLNTSCSKSKQVLNIQSVGYAAAILVDVNHDDDDDSRAKTVITKKINEKIWSFNKNITLEIPSTIVSNHTGQVLFTFSGKTNITTTIFRDVEDFNQLILILLGTLCLAIIAALLIFLVIYGCYRFYKIRKSIVTKWKLKWLPVHIYQKGDTYEVCVICLDGYIEGAKLRVLSCGHAFHCKCVDPWLIKSGRECPLCKRKADLRRGKGHRPQRDRDDTDESKVEADERTALLESNSQIDDCLVDEFDNDDGDEDQMQVNERQTTVNAIIHSSEQEERPSSIQRRSYGTTHCPNVIIAGVPPERNGRRKIKESKRSADRVATVRPFQKLHELRKPKLCETIQASSQVLQSSCLLPPPEQNRATFYIGSVTTDEDCLIGSREVKVDEISSEQAETSNERHGHLNNGVVVDDEVGGIHVHPHNNLEPGDDNISTDDYYDATHDDVI